MLDRTVAPVVQAGGALDFPCLRSEVLDNGMRYHSLCEGSTPAVKVQLLFPGGRSVQRGRLEADVALTLLTKGARGADAEAVAGRVDYLGARFYSAATPWYGKVSLSCVANRLEDAWGLLADALVSPSYDPTYFETWRKKQKAGAEIREQESSYLASRALQSALLAGHPLGRVVAPGDYDTLSLEEAKSFYVGHVLPRGAQVLVSGGLDARQEDRVMGMLGELEWGDGGACAELLPPVDATCTPESLVLSEAPIGNQVSVELGRLTPSLPLGEELDLRIAVMLLGGFFGSRLMRVIREEKGYTYGIHAYVARMEGGLQLVVSSEIGSQYIHDALPAIAAEMVRLCEELPSAEEMAVLRNYMRGMLLRSFDGVFSSVRQLRSLLVHRDLPADYYRAYAARIGTISAEDIRAAAARWLGPAGFTLSAAGALRELDGIKWG